MHHISPDTSRVSAITLEFQARRLCTIESPQERTIVVGIGQAEYYY
jgi:hypothetical protein